MTVIADDKSRVQLRHWQVQPGDVWSVEASTPGRLVLTKQESAPPQRNLLEHLRDLAGLEIPERRVHCPPRA